MAAVLVLIMFLAIAGVHLWLRSRARRAGVASAVQVSPVPMGEPHAPPGVFLDEGHAWVRFGTDGLLRTGIDAFLAGALGQALDIELPPRGKTVQRGDVLFRIGCGARWLDVSAPMDGEVVFTHGDTVSQPWLVTTDPYGVGWVVALRNPQAKASLAPLKTGPSATAFLRAEMQRWVEFLATSRQVAGMPLLADGAAPARGAAVTLTDDKWTAFVATFVDGRSR